MAVPVQRKIVSTLFQFGRCSISAMNLLFNSNGDENRAFQFSKKETGDPHRTTQRESGGLVRSSRHPYISFFIRDFS